MHSSWTFHEGERGSNSIHGQSSPSSLGDDHFSCGLVESCPEISAMEDDLNAIGSNGLSSGG